MNRRRKQVAEQYMHSPALTCPAGVRLCTMLHTVSWDTGSLVMFEEKCCTAWPSSVSRKSSICLRTSRCGGVGKGEEARVSLRNMVHTGGNVKVQMEGIRWRAANRGLQEFERAEGLGLSSNPKTRVVQLRVMRGPAPANARTWSLSTDCSPSCLDKTCNASVRSSISFMVSSNLFATGQLVRLAH